MAKFVVSYAEKRSITRYENFTISYQVEGDDADTMPEYAKDMVVEDVQRWADKIQKERTR